MTKKEALSIVFSCAPLYKENLVDRSLLFITTDKHKNVHCLEVTFDIGNFLHMTGFKLRKPGINARHFFNLLSNGEEAIWKKINILVFGLILRRTEN